jgi:hypothetical protein
MRAIDWSAHCASKRFRPDGGLRLTRYCRAKRLARGLVTQGSRRQLLRIRLHQDFGRSR